MSSSYKVVRPANFELDLIPGYRVKIVDIQLITFSSGGEATLQFGLQAPDGYRCFSIVRTSSGLVYIEYLSEPRDHWQAFSSTPKTPETLADIWWFVELTKSLPELLEWMTKS